jgi:hypothetical protein
VRFVVEMLSALKERQDSKLLKLLQQEHIAEDERGRLYSGTDTPEDRYRLDKILGIERIKAGKRIAIITERQEQEFVATRERLEAENGISIADLLLQKRSTGRRAC